MSRHAAQAPFRSRKLSSNARFRMPTMDSSETLVDAHLRHRGFLDIVSEPDGNIPPDFLVNGNIAIEVRRLNQNDFTGPAAKGLEEVAIPLWKKVKTVAAKMGPPINGESWFIHFRYKRPVEEWKTLEGKIISALAVFMVSKSKTRQVIAKGTNFELEVFCRTSNPHSDMFVLAGCADDDSGGWLLAEMETNIRHCASEKEGKVAKVRSKYLNWWLALVDYVGYGLDEFDREMFRDQVSITHTWDKIIIINTRDHTRWFEI